MTTEDWFDALTAELLQQSPFRRSEYFRRFASGALSRADVWGHIAQHYLLIAWFPRIFSGIHTRCEDFEVRKDCARHLLVEDLGYFDGRVGGTPDHDELFRRIGDDLGYPRAPKRRTRRTMSGCIIAPGGDHEEAAGDRDARRGPRWLAPNAGRCGRSDRRGPGPRRLRGLQSARRRLPLAP